MSWDGVGCVAQVRCVACIASGTCQDLVIFHFISFPFFFSVWALAALAGWLAGSPCICMIEESEAPGAGLGCVCLCAFFLFRCLLRVGRFVVMGGR